jgi:hypothetical protein
VRSNFLPTDSPQELWPYNLGPDPPDEARRRVLRLDAVYDDNSNYNYIQYFKLAESGQKLRPMTVDLDSISVPETDGSPLYLPSHLRCVHIADCFVHSIDTGVLAAPEEDHGKITSIRQLWEVLYRRLPGYEDANEYWSAEPHDYFAGRSCRKADWEYGEDEMEGEVRIFNPSLLLLCLFSNTMIATRARPSRNTKYYRVDLKKPGVDAYGFAYWPNP